VRDVILMLNFVCTYASPVDRVWMSFVLDKVFKIDAAIYGALVCSLFIGVHSGHPLTTLIDIFGNALGIKLISKKSLAQLKGQVYMDKAWKASPNIEHEVKTFGDLMQRNCAEMTPYRLKWKGFVRLAESGFTGIEFLGMKVFRNEGVCLPIADEQKLVDALVFPRNRNGKQPSVVRERALGLVIAGGWYYDKYYETCKRLYSGMGSLEFNHDGDFAALNVAEMKEFLDPRFFIEKAAVQLMFVSSSKDNLRKLLRDLSEGPEIIPEHMLWPKEDEELPVNDEFFIVPIDKLDEQVTPSFSLSSSSSSGELYKDDLKVPSSLIEKMKRVPPPIPTGRVALAAKPLVIPLLDPVSRTPLVIPSGAIDYSSMAVTFKGADFVHADKATKINPRSAIEDAAKNKRHREKLELWRRNKMMKREDIRRSYEEGRGKGGKKIGWKTFLNTFNEVTHGVGGDDIMSLTELSEEFADEFMEEYVLEAEMDAADERAAQYHENE